MAQYRITFLPMDRVFIAEDSENLLEIAMKYGIHINASCGGNAACGKCRVKVIKGDVYAPINPKISQREYDAGMRLACMTVPRGDITVEIPLESQIDRSVLKRRRAASHILSAIDIGQLVKGWEVDPAVFKRYIELPEPSLQDNISDLGRLMREIKRKYNIENITVDFKILTRLSRILRDSRWKVTVTIVLTRKGCKLINIEHGNTEDKNFSIVIDIGTTTVCGQILDLANCSALKLIEQTGNGRDVCTLAESSDYNPEKRGAEEA